MNKLTVSVKSLKEISKNHSPMFDFTSEMESFCDCEIDVIREDGENFWSSSDGRFGFDPRWLNFPFHCDSCGLYFDKQETDPSRPADCPNCGSSGSLDEIS